MKITKKNYHPTFCGGAEYSFEVELENEKTVEDVLDGLCEYNKKHYPNEAYGIYINGTILKSTWAGEREEDKLPSYKRRYKGNKQEKVISIHGCGGWYCGASFYIDAEEV